MADKNNLSARFNKPTEAYSSVKIIIREEYAKSSPKRMFIILYLTFPAT